MVAVIVTKVTRSREEIEDVKESLAGIGVTCHWGRTPKGGHFLYRAIEPGDPAAIISDIGTQERAEFA